MGKCLEDAGGGGVRVRSLSNIYSVGVLHGKKEEKLY